jgi:hypothetical protein
MANKYFSKQDPTDFSIQSEDGGGLVFSKDAKYIFGAKQDNITKQLNEEGFEGNVDINPNTNSSFIAIMNENSVPVDVDIPNTNQYSIFEPQEENIVTTSQSSIPTPSPTPGNIPPSSPSISPSPTSPIPLTAQEEEEGIYEANFLPAVETTGSQIFDNIIPVTDVSVVIFFENPLNLNYYNNNQPSTLTYNSSGKGKATNAIEYYGDGAPYINQKTGWACLVTSLVMLEQYANKKNITEETFINFTSQPPQFNKNNTRKPPYVDINNNFQYKTFSSAVGNISRISGDIDRQTAFNNYKQKLTETKKPIIIKIAGTTVRAKGHYVLAVGITENKNIIIHNPANQNVAFKDTELSVNGLLNEKEQSTGFNYDIIYLK